MSIDLNCDLGEGIGNDALIMPLISSCNIACGGHAGDADSMRETLLLAQQHDVKIGAHPSYPDKEHFGRQTLEMTPADLTESIYAQIMALQTQAVTLGATIHHVKLHGALYNDAAVNKIKSKAIIAALKRLPFKPKLYVPSRSVLAQQARLHKFEVVFEAFIDRHYQNDLTLVPRHQPLAMIENPKEAYKQLYRIAVHKSVTCVSGERKTLKAYTFCVHGDNMHAVEFLKYIREACLKHHLNID